jgi:hypothetical protein
MCVRLGTEELSGQVVHTPLALTPATHCLSLGLTLRSNERPQGQLY